jgi:hypothetical protein
MEHAQILHLFNAVLSLYLFILFIWWWIEKGDATYIYRITCFLMLGLFTTHAGAFYLYCNIAGLAGNMTLLNSWYWPLRQYLVMLPLIAYAVHITRKIHK